MIFVAPLRPACPDFRPSGYNEAIELQDKAWQATFLRFLERDWERCAHGRFALRKRQLKPLDN